MVKLFLGFSTSRKPSKSLCESFLLPFGMLPGAKKGIPWSSNVFAQESPARPPPIMSTSIFIEGILWFRARKNN
jgi:hypothetical protein